MPNKLSNTLSSHKEHARAKFSSQPPTYSQSEAPPTYAQVGATYDEEDVIHPPDLTARFSRLQLKERCGDDAIPELDECIAHLKVLESFYRLRQSIGSHDGLFGIQDRVVLNQPIDQNEQTPMLANLAEKRWAVYVQRAVDRFEKWW